METANLIMLIVALIILSALSFFIFQIWIQSKETKLQLTNFLQELHRGFSSTDNSMKSTAEQVIENYKTETKSILAAIDILKEQLKQTDNDIKKYKEEISEQINTVTNTSDTKLNEAFESHKNKTHNRIGELNDTVKLFKEQLDERMKELDKHLTGKLVNDLTNITKQYLDNLNEKHLTVLNEFSKTSKEVKEEQKRLLKAITEPLKINTDGND